MPADGPSSNRPGAAARLIKKLELEKEILPVRKMMRPPTEAALTIKREA